MADDQPLPQLLELDEGDAEVFGLAMHPSRDLLALGLVDGRALLYAYEGMGETCTLAAALSPHAEACRAVEFHPEGQAVFTASSDKSLRMHDVATGREAWAVQDAHVEALNCLHFCAAEGLLASGDDAGVVKLWDCRAAPSKAASTITKNEDFIADLLSHDGLLFAASGDNTLLTYDLQARKPLTRSMDQEDELLSLCVVKKGRKLVAGTQSGVLLVYSWGQWANSSDRFVGHPETVESMVRVDEETILTGSSDGLIRLCTVQPNKILGVLGAHPDDFPVERLAFAHDRRLLASVAHDHAVRLWDMTILEDDDGGEEDQASEESSEEEAAAPAKRRKQEQAVLESSGEEEEEEEDSDSEEDASFFSDSDSDSGGGSGNGSSSDEEEEEEQGMKGKGRGKEPAAAAQQKKEGAGKGKALKVGKGEGKAGGGERDDDSDSSASAGGQGTGSKGKKTVQQGQEEQEEGDGKGRKGKGKKKLRMTEAETFFSDL